jgi:antitoxin component YwqK of YwqJK toxin-antitoxin module
VYCPTGKISEDENYVYGNEEGLQKYYFADGNLKAEENYFNGEKDGVSKYYYDNGKVEHIENWVLGSHHGKYYYYDKTGKLIRTAVYYNDDMIYESAQSETGTNKAQPKVQPKAPQPKAGGTGTHK